MSDLNEVKLEEEAAASANNKEVSGLAHPTIKREDSKLNKPTDSLDINDQNILDYDDELDNNLNTMNTKEVNDLGFLNLKQCLRHHLLHTIRQVS